MKKALNLMLIILIAIWVCPESLAQRAIKNGVSLPTRGTLNALVVFAQVRYDQGPCIGASTSLPNGLQDNINNPWTVVGGVTQPPNWADNLFDHEFTGASNVTPGTVTELYYHASFGQYIILGDYYPNVIDIPCSVITNTGKAQILGNVINALNAEPGTTLTTAHGQTLPDFDSYTIPVGGQGTLKSGPGDDKIDLLYVIFRTNRFLFSTNNKCESGFGAAQDNNSTQIKDIGGVNVSAEFVACGNGTKGGFGSTVAEHLHAIFGGNNFHSTGGAGPYTFMVPPFSFSLTGQSGSIRTIGWDRWMQDWKGWVDINKTTQKFWPISCASTQVGQEIFSDFSQIFFSLSQQTIPLVLRDFATYGDALRLELPFTEKDGNPNVKRQYIWIENRQLLSDLDRNILDDLPCTDDGRKGLYAYIQVGKDLLSGSSNDLYAQFPFSQDNALGSWLWPLQAEGNHDYPLLAQDVSNCARAIPTIPYDKDNALPNPFTGYSDFYMPVNSNGDDFIKRYSTSSGCVGDCIGSKEVPFEDGAKKYNIPFFGDSKDAFNFATGTTKFYMASNPAPVPRYTYTNSKNVGPNPSQTGHPAGYPTVVGDYENRTIWLNGISVKIIEENFMPADFGPGAVKIELRYDDYEVDQDVRWCGNIKLSPTIHPITLPLDDPTEYSLNLMPNKTILIDRGTSPTQHEKTKVADPVNGDELFTQPSEFTCRPNSYFHMEPNSKVIVKNKSTFRIRSNAKLEVHENAEFIVKSGCKLILEQGAQLDIHNTGLVKIEPGATLEYSNSDIVLGGSEAVIEIGGILDIADNSTFTFQGGTFGCGYVRFTSPSGQPNILGGTNSSFILNNICSGGKVLEVRNGFLHASQDLQVFRVQDAIIEFRGTLNEMIMKPYFIFTNVDFNSIASANGRLITYGQPVAIINNCTFNRTWITALNFGTGNSLTITNSDILSNPNLGLFIVGGGINLDNVRYENNGRGMFGIALEHPSIITDSEFNLNFQYGMEYMWCSENLVRITNSQIDENYPGGIYADDVSLQVKCGSVANNSPNTGGIGFNLFNNSTLNMSSAVGAGYVDASGNKVTIQTNNAKTLRLGLGLNNLEPDGSGGFFLPSNVRGTIQLPACPSPVLAATGNRWGPLPNTQPGNGFFNFLNSEDGCFVSILDNSPSSASCGTFDPDPCLTFPIPCAELVVNSCPTCPIINTSDFAGKKLNEAVSIAISNMELEDNSKDDLVAIDQFHQILTLPLDRSNPDVDYLVNLAYTHMKDALGSAFANAKITEDDNITQFHPSVLQVSDVQDTLIDDSVTQSQIRTRFLLELDKSHLHRLAGKRNAALQILRDADSCPLSDEDRKYLKRRTVLMEAEILVLTEQEPVENFVSLLEKADVFDLPGINLFDSTSVIDSTVSVGDGVSVGADTEIGANTTIGDDVTIDKNVTIEDNVTLSDETSVGENTVIGMNTYIGETTSIGDNVEISKDAKIGENVVIEDNVNISKDVVIGDNVTLKEGAFIKKDVEISDGACIESNVRIGMTTAIGTNAIIGSDTRVGNDVLIGDETVVEEGVTVSNGAETGTRSVIEEGTTLGVGASVCDSEATSGNVANNGSVGSCVSPTDPTDPANVIIDCDFAIARADMHQNFFNGFTAGTGSGQSICAGDIVTFAADKSSNQVFWDFGDCNSSTDLTPEHIYSNPGIYVIKLVQDLGCTSDDTLIGSVSVYPALTLSLEFSASCDSLREITVSRDLEIGDFQLPICSLQSSSCNNVNAPLDTARLRIKFEWNFGTQIFAPLVETFSINQVLSGNLPDLLLAYPVNSSFDLEATSTLELLDLHNNTWNALNCASAVSQTLITSELMKVNFVSGDSVCDGDEISFLNSTTGGSLPISWLWDFGDTQTSTREFPTHNFTTPDSFAVKLVATDVLGCSDSATKVVANVGRAEAAFSFTINGNEVNFQNESPAASIYFWDFGDGNTSIAENPTNTYLTQGVFEACLVAITCDSDSVCQTINIASGFQKAYGGIGQDKGTGVINTSDGGFASVGFTNSFGAGNMDVSVIKTEVDGSLMWSKTYGGSNLDDANSIRQTSDGGYIIGGRTRSFGSTLNKGLVIKTDANGDVQWSKVFSLPGNLFFSVIRELSGGGYAIVGNTDVGGGGKNILFAKIDASGNEVFVKAIGGGGNQFSHHVEPANDGGFIILGDTRAGSDIDLIAIKTDAAGNIQWSKSYSGLMLDIGQSSEEVELLCAAGGGFVFAGFTNSQGAGVQDGMLVKVDAIGNLLWANTYGGVNNDRFFTIKQEPVSEDFLMCGGTNSFGAGLSDIYFVRTDNSGNLVESNAYGGTNNDNMSTTDDIFQLTPDGGIVIGGFTGSFGVGSDDFYLIKTDGNGNTGCNEVTSVPTQVNVATVGVSSVSHPVVSTSFSVIGHSLIETSPATVETAICPVPSAKWGNVENGDKEVTSEDEIEDVSEEAQTLLKSYPNPFSDQTTIEFRLPITERTTVEIQTLAGERVAVLFDAVAVEGRTYKVAVDGGVLSDGIYFYTLRSENTQITEKLIVIK